MATYIRSWLSPQLSVLPSYETPIPPQIHEINSSEDDNDDPDSDGTIKGDKEEDDVPPSFPALNSAQRMSSRSSVPRILTDSELMPPPPPPKLASRRPGVQPASSSLSVPASASSLAVPTTTTKPPAKKASRKVALAPGHGPLDWANLKKSGADLRGVDTLLRIPMSVLKQHNKRDDAWSAFNGKVYNITPYLPYHPGGEKELLRVAGRDGTKLFSLTHAWVNVDYMLDTCLVGFLVPDS